MAGNFEFFETAAECGGSGGALFGEDFLEEIGAVGDEAVDTETDDGAHLVRVVGGPGDDTDAGALESGDRDLSVED